MTRNLALALGLALAQVAAAPAPRALPLTLVADLPLPGGATRFDYQSLDVDQRRLYLAHLGDSSLLVFDLDNQRVMHEVPGLPSVHGVIAAPAQHLILATATAERTLVIIDDRTFQIKARVPAGAYPNGLAYDPKSGRAFISNNSGRGVGVVDVNAERALEAIAIGGGAGNTQYDSTSGHVLAAVHGVAALVEIDPVTAKIVRRIALRGVSSCHGLLVATPQRVAFAVCHGAAPALVVVDLGKCVQIQTLPLPSDIDVLGFDPDLHRLYAASETGTVAVFATVPGAAVAELGRGFVGPNAHSVAVDPKTHLVYFPLRSVNGSPVLRVMRPAPSE